MSAPFRIVKYDRKFAIAAVTMWRDSKQQALGISEMHSFDDHLEFLDGSLARDNEVYLAILQNSERVVGLLATDGEWVNQLYIHNDFQRQGIGTRLLQLAKDNASGKLQLVTFEINSIAREFYEKHDFHLIGRGNDNEEGLPHLLYQWGCD